MANKKSNDIVIALGIRVNSERHGIEVVRPDRKLTDKEFAVLSSLKDYGLTWFDKYNKYLNQAFRVDVVGILQDKRFSVTKSPTFDEDYKAVMEYWKKNPSTKTSKKSSKTTTKSSKTSSKASTPTVAPQNSAPDNGVIDQLKKEIANTNARIDGIENTCNEIKELMLAFMAK